jgi:presenilin-like A22 family membrane protease
MIKLIDERDVENVFVMFGLALGLGMLLIYAIVTSHSLQSVEAAITSPHSVILSYALDVVLGAAIGLMLLNRHRRHPAIASNKLFIVFEGAVVIATSVFFFIALFVVIFPTTETGYLVMASILSSLALIMAKDIHRNLRNAVTIVSSIGVGIFMGLYLNFEMAMIVLAIVSIYDYLAVFITRSMLALAGVIEDEDLSLVICSSHIDAVPESDYNKKEVSRYLAYLKQANEDKDPKFARILSLGELPVISQVQLGEGDIGLPIMAIISSYITFSNLAVSLLILAGSMIGLLAATYTLQKYRKPLPAIPPIFFFIFVSAATSLWATDRIVEVLPMMVVTGFVAVSSFFLALEFALRKRNKIEVNKAVCRAMSSSRARAHAHAHAR